MITEDFVSFETANLLKEKGFDEKCNSFYRKTLANNKLIDKEELHLAGTLFLTNGELQEKSYEQLVYCTAPTLQMAMKWLREVHKWHIEISRGEYGYFVHIVSAKNLSTENYAVRIEGGYNLSYEEACEAGIRYCLENLI